MLYDSIFVQIKYLHRKQCWSGLYIIASHYSEPLKGTNLLLTRSCDSYGLNLYSLPHQSFLEPLVVIPVNVTSFRSRDFADQIKII